MQSEQVTTRLNKFISETGICSRREADRLIEQGQVTVNGRVAETGMTVTAADDVVVSGKPLRAKPKAVYLVYHKPVGITCTTDTAVAGNIVDAVKYPARIFPIGRLDKPSSGLILLTNDGDIVNKILRAGNAHEKEYLVSVDKPITRGFIERMAAGVPILGTVTKPCVVKQTGPSSFSIILTQGLNRQIRRMTEFLGYEVTRLKRIRIMTIQLADLKPGQWREVSTEEFKMLSDLLKDSVKTEEASHGAGAGIKKRSGHRPRTERPKRQRPPER
ncbi:MAG: 23S rRNA pseudouridine(2604) synthase RluF [Alkalimonas sp.]|nr:23S rRNA pseudouridine(2604) synthase RluF [Alkalimonas sp.]